MKPTNALPGDQTHTGYTPSVAPDITMPATTAPVVVQKQPSARKLAKERLLNSISSLYSPNAKDVYDACGYILKVTHSGYDTNQPDNLMYIEQFPDIVNGIANLLDTLMPLTIIHFNNIPQQYDKSSIKPSSNPLFFETNCFLPDNDLNGSKLLKLFDTATVRMTNALIDENLLILTVLAIIRNLSFEVANELYMATSTSIMRHLVFIATTCRKESEASKLAYDTLILLSPRIDFCNRRRPSNYLSNFNAIENMYVESSKKAAIMFLKLSKQYCHETITEYNTSLMVLTAYIYQSILTCGDRNLLLKALELMSRLVMINDNGHIISRLSDEMLEMLTELLCATTTSLEPLYADSVTNIFHKQPACFNSTYNAIYDDEIREYAIDILYGLFQNGSTDMHVRLGNVPCFTDILFKILDTRTDKYIIKGDERTKKVESMLNMLAARPEHYDKFKSLEVDITIAAMNDELIAESYQTLTTHTIGIKPIKYAAIVDDGTNR